jgi:hypothetical protein
MGDNNGRSWLFLVGWYSIRVVRLASLFITTTLTRPHSNDEMLFSCKEKTKETFRITYAVYRAGRPDWKRWNRNVTVFVDSGMHVGCAAVFAASRKRPGPPSLLAFFGS